MALVRKLKEGGQKFIYENVGEYNADDLAAKLTEGLTKQANKLGLQGTNRQDFINSGAELIKAIKEGRVSKGTNGNLNITGGSDKLNNVFTDKDIQDKKDNGEVGRGASKYEGSYQESHGIFTTQGTENFREHNHVLGLLTNYVNDTLSEVGKKKEEKDEKKVPYDFSSAFNNANLGGVNNLTQWVSLNNDLDKRIQGVRNAIAKADYAKWADAYDMYDEAQLRAGLEEVDKLLKQRNINGARNEALKYGIDLSNYFANQQEQQTPEELAAAEEEKQRLAEEARLAAYEETIKATVLKDHPGAKGAYLASLIQDVKDKEAANEQQYYKDKADAKFNEAWVKSLGEVKPLAIWNLPIEQEELQQLEEFANGGNKYTLHYDNTEFTNALNEIRNNLLPSFNNEVSYTPELLENQEYALKALVHQYDILKDSKDKEGKTLFNSLFENISNDPKQGFILKDFKQGTKALIFKDNQLQVVDLSTIEGRPEYEKRKKSFKEEYDKIPLNKQGGILKADEGTSFSNISKYHQNQETQQANQKVKENKIKEKLQNITERADRLQQLYNFTPEGARLRLDRPMSKWEIGERITSLGADIASLGVSASSSEFGGSIPSGLLSLGSTVLNTIADREAGMDWASAFNNNIGSYGMDALAFAPYGKIAQGSKIAAKAYTLGAGLLATYGAVNLRKQFPEFKETFSKIGNKDQNLNAQDWQNILDAARYTLSAGATGATMVRSAKHANAFIDEKNSKVRTKDGNVVTIDKDKANALKGEKDVAEANAKFKQAQLDAGIEESAIKELPTSKLFWAKEKPKVTQYPAVKDAIYVEHPKKGVMEVNLGHVPGTGLTKTISDGLHWVTDKMSLLKPKSTIITKEQFDAKRAELAAKKKVNTSEIQPNEVPVEQPVINQPSPEASQPIEVNKGKRKNKKKKHFNGGSLEFTYNALNKYYNGGRLIPKADGGTNTYTFRKPNNINPWMFEDYEDTPEHGRSQKLFGKAYNQESIINDLLKNELDNIGNWNWDSFNQLYSKDLNDGIDFNSYNSAPSSKVTKWNEIFHNTGLNKYFNYDQDANGYVGVSTNARNGLLQELATKYNNPDNLFYGRYYDSTKNEWVTPSLTNAVASNMPKLNRPEDPVLVDPRAAKKGETPKTPLSINKGYALNDKGEVIDQNTNQVVADKVTQLTGAEEESYWDQVSKNLQKKSNLVPASELERTLRMNHENSLANEVSKRYPIVTEGLINRNSKTYNPILETQQAEQNAANLNNTVQQHQSSSQENNTLNAIQATSQANQGYMQAAINVANSLIQQEQQANNIANEDKMYNLGAMNRTNANIANKIKEDVQGDANTILRNAANIDNYWKAQNMSQLNKQHDQEELAKESILSQKALENQAAIVEYEQALKNGAPDAFTTFKRKTGLNNQQATELISYVIGTNNGKYTAISTKHSRGFRKGGQFDRYILQGAKDHNKRKLEEAREFHKRIKSKK